MTGNFKSIILTYDTSKEIPIASWSFQTKAVTAIALHGHFHLCVFARGNQINLHSFKHEFNPLCQFQTTESVITAIMVSDDILALGSECGNVILCNLNSILKGKMVIFRKIQFGHGIRMPIRSISQFTVTHFVVDFGNRKVSYICNFFPQNYTYERGNCVFPLS